MINMEEYRRHRLGGLEYAVSYYQNQRNQQTQAYREQINTKNQAAYNKALQASIKASKPSTIGTTIASTVASTGGGILSNIGKKYGGQIMGKLKSSKNIFEPGKDGELNEYEKEFNQSGKFYDSEEQGTATDYWLKGGGGSEQDVIDRAGIMREYDAADPNLRSAGTVDESSGPGEEARGLGQISDEQSRYLDQLPEEAEDDESFFPPERPPRVQSLTRRSSASVEPDEEDYGPAPEVPPRRQSLRRSQRVEPQEEEEYDPNEPYVEEPFVSDLDKPDRWADLTRGKLTLGDADREDLTETDLGIGTETGGEMPESGLETDPAFYLKQQPTGLDPQPSLFSRAKSFLGFGGKEAPTEEQEFAGGVADKVAGESAEASATAQQNLIDEAVQTKLNKPVDLAQRMGALGEDNQSAPGWDTLARLTQPAKNMDAEPAGSSSASAAADDVLPKRQNIGGEEKQSEGYDFEGFGDEPAEEEAGAAAGEGLEIGEDTAIAGGEAAIAGGEAAIDTAAVGADAVAAATAPIPGLDIATAIVAGVATVGAGIFGAVEGVKALEKKSPKAVKPDDSTPDLAPVSVAGKYVGASSDNYFNANQHFSGF